MLVLSGFLLVLSGLLSDTIIQNVYVTMTEQLPAKSTQDLFNNLNNEQLLVQLNLEQLMIDQKQQQITQIERQIQSRQYNINYIIKCLKINK